MTQVIDMRKEYTPTLRQCVAHSASERYVLYGGAVGGGKSAWMTNEAIQLSLDYPGNVGYLCRHELASFRRTTLLTLQAFLPAGIISQHHQTESYYRLINGSTIYYGGLGDDQKAIDRLKSMDLGWFAIDQAEETSEQHFFMLASRLRLRVKNIRYKGLLSANPSPGWVKSRFIEQKLNDHIFIPALPSDNPYLPGDYEANLRELYPEELVRQLLEGDWDALEIGNYLLRYADIKLAVGREFDEMESPVNVLGVDIARFGDDHCVAILKSDRAVKFIERWAKVDTMGTAGRIASLIDQHQPDYTHIDVIGIGAGVCDRLKELKYRISPIAVSESPKGKNKEKMLNLRAEIYNDLRIRFEEGEISIPDNLNLSTELSSIRFTFNSAGKLQIESKEAMKHRGVKSPDMADALALAFMNPTRREPRIRWL